MAKALAEVHSYEDATRFLESRRRDKTTAKIANNTYIQKVDDDINVVLHNTVIVTYKPNGEYVLNTGGYQTVTTKDRLNAFTPFSVRSTKGVWYVHHRGDSVPFVEGMVIGADGSLPSVDITETTDYNKKIRKKIQEYVAGYTDERIKFLLNKAQEEGVAGDCWFCSMIDKPEAPGQYYGWSAASPISNLSSMNDHLLDHLDEGYYMASLMANAVTAKGYQQPVVILHHAPDAVRRAIKSYLTKRLIQGTVAVR